MIKNLLIPVDGSEHTKKIIEFAADIAKQKNAAVHLLQPVYQIAMSEN
jgi:nucleotide-binding universal stress UspA family protein